MVTMSAQRRSGRFWFAGIVALALVLVGVASGAHLASWRSGTTARVAASSAAAIPSHHTRAVDAGPAHHVVAPSLLDPSTPPQTAPHHATAGRQVAAVEPLGPSFRTLDADHPGRAPPTA